MDTATLSGTIVDQSGALVPGVVVTITNQGTNVMRQTMSTDAGVYSFPGLKPGTYRVAVELQGFKRVVVNDIVLNVQDAVNRNFTLQVGGTSEIVQVNGDAVNVNTTGGSVGTVVDRNFVDKLPVNGRSFQGLILLTPGMVMTDTSASTPGSFSVNGQRGNANYFVVDGVSANLFANQGYQMEGSNPGLTAAGGTNNLISVDALEEFKIQTSTYSAEFGRQPGAQVTLVTRSGKNKFRGTLFESLRNDAMDAREYFNRVPAAKPPLRQNHFGGTFGGPIIQNRTFFFFSYEDQRLRLPQSGIVYVPSLTLRGTAAPALRPIFNAWPLPTGPELLTTTACAPGPTNPMCAPSGVLYAGWAPLNYSISDPSSVRATSLRLDHTFNRKLTIFARYNHSPSERLTHGGSVNAYSNAILTRTLTAGATAAITPRLTNDLRINSSRNRNKMSYKNDPFGGAEPLDIKSLLSYQGPGNKFAAVSVNMNGRNSSLSFGDSFDIYQRQINIVDNLSWMKGRHQFKFGMDFRRMFPIYGPREYYTTLNFTSPAVIAAGNLSTVNVNAYPVSRLIYDSFSAFAQDTWKVSPRLTLDLGVRWEINPAPREETGKMPVTLLGIVGTDTSNAYIAPPGTPFYKTFYRAFGPRLGVAYQLNQASGRETVLRGGWGLFYDLGQGQVSKSFAFGFPNVSTKIISPNHATACGGSPCPATIPYPLPEAWAVPPSMPTVSLPLAGAAYALNPDLKLPYSHQWNLTIEQALGTQQSISLAYVASASRRLIMTNNMNAPKGYTSGGQRPNPNFQYIYFTDNGPSADYHSFQAQYRARMKRGFQALVNYTWAHALDEVSNEVTGYDFERGNATFDIRHNFSAALTYDIPKLSSIGLLPESVSGIAKAVVNNWSISSIIHAKTGRPVDVWATQAFVEDGSTVTGRPDLVPGQPLYIKDPSVPGGRRFNVAAFSKPPANLEYPTQQGRQGTFGRNILRELSIYQIDLGVTRSFRFTENSNIQFKGEIFNLPNHPLFGSYGYLWSATSTTFGVPTTTLNRRLGGLNQIYQLGGPRSIQFSLKLSF